jgi:hypothetical protein
MQTSQDRDGLIHPSSWQEFHRSSNPFGSRIRRSNLENYSHTTGFLASRLGRR